MQIEKAQNLINKLFKDISHPRLASFIALTEEVGELANEILKKEIYEESLENSKIKTELLDVFICVIEIANLYNINLTEEFEKKLKTLKPRVKEWENSKDLLKRKRLKLD